MNKTIQEDYMVAGLFGLLVLLLISGLTSAHWVFAYGVVAWVGTLAGVGFVRRRQFQTWIAAALVVVFLFVGMTGVLINESAIVLSPKDTVLGFQAGTASLIYLIWIPGLFTLGVSFVVLFNRLVAQDTKEAS